MENPSWIDAETWDAFVEMRKAKGKRAPFTARAAKMILHELDRLRSQGHNPDEVLRVSVMNGWSGVFALKHLDSSKPRLANDMPLNPQIEATRRYLDREAVRPVQSPSDAVKARLLAAKQSIRSGGQQ